MAPKPLTADMLARAVIAAAATFGDDPLRAFTVGRGPFKRALTPAAAAVADLTGRAVQPVGALLGLRGNNFSRSRGLPGYEAAYKAAIEAAQAAMPAPAPAPAPPPAAKARVVTALAAMKLVLAELAKGPATGPDLMEALGLGEGQVRVALETLSEEREARHTPMTAEGWRAIFWRLPE